MARTKGAKDIRKRRYNPESGRNLFRTYPKIATAMVTLNTHQQLPAGATLKEFVNTDGHVRRVAEVAHYVEDTYGLKVATDQHWEVGGKDHKVHCHWIHTKMIYSEREQRALTPSGCWKDMQIQAGMIVLYKVCVWGGSCQRNSCVRCYPA